MGKKTNHSKCINNVRNEIMKADNTVTYVRFDLSTITDGNRSDITGQRIFLGSEKNGKQKEEKSFISHTFCPFCGGKY